MLSSHNWEKLCLTELRDAIRSGDLSSKEVTVATIEAMEKAGVELNCVARIHREEALARADALDRDRTRGEIRGALHGVPLAHKDVFFRKGYLTEGGSIIHKGFRPSYSARVVDMLDSAGAIDIGRLHMVELALGPTGYNEFSGSPINPKYPNHIPGGSSSGSAVAVAGNLVTASLGTDTGGSVRGPASCCGIVGFKPTFGVVSTQGIMPLSHSLDQVGCLTRNINDCSLLFDSIVSPSILSGSKEYRVFKSVIAIPSAHYLKDIEPKVKESFYYAINLMRQLDITIIEVDIPDFKLANSCANIMISVEGATLHAISIQENINQFGINTITRLLPGLAYPASTYLDVLELRKALAKQFYEMVFRKAHYLITPIFKTEIPARSVLEPENALQFDYAGFSEFLRPINVYGFPSISIPVQQNQGDLPFSIQIVAPPFRDWSLLKLAQCYEMASADGKSDKGSSDRLGTI